MRFTEYDHVAEAVTSSKTSRTDENLVVFGACASVSEHSSTDDVLGRRRRPFGLSATPEDRDPGAGSAPAVEAHGKQDRGDAAEGRDAGEGRSQNPAGQSAA